MKKLLSLLLVLMMSITALVGCLGEEEPPKPTDTELITERVETFVEAYNDGDMNAVLACLDAKTRNAFQALLNVAGGIAGSVTGVSIDLKDLFALGVSTTSGDFMDLKISSISIKNDKNATVTTTMNLAETGDQKIYFYFW